jgi:uncharacterized protein (TIGR02246 family)
MKATIAVCTLVLIAAMHAQRPAISNPAELEIRQIPQRLSLSWDQTDAKAMASLFADDADLVIPSGDVLSGRPAIQSFYQSVFEHGYRGSHAGAEVKRVRVMGAMAIVDGAWSITGAKDATGASRPLEQGLFTAVLEKQEGRWRVSALREMVPAGK